MDPIALARFLIGVTLVRRDNRQTLSARIVETEAYLPDDPASHGFNGRTSRNGSIFTVRGHAYVYRIYGVWWCLNVSAGKAKDGAAVLIRALEPLSGVASMQRRRPGVSAKNRCLPQAIGASVRIGLNKAQDSVLRFYERGSTFLSGSARLNL